MTSPGACGPDPNCDRCPRLAAFRRANRLEHPDWFNAPVPSFGGADAWLLIVGLAPGLKGANRTGRPFTGDYAGELLYVTLLKFGLAEGAYGAAAGDGLRLKGCRITNAVRCVPPENKPTPAEVTACQSFLIAEMAALKQLKVVLALGGVAHQTVVSTLGGRRKDCPFGHGRLHTLSGGLRLADSYHCSRYNTNTGKLTETMFHEVFARIMPLGGN
jgi:uracil-DNA glycosylase family 4